MQLVWGKKTNDTPKPANCGTDGSLETSLKKQSKLKSHLTSQCLPPVEVCSHWADRVPSIKPTEKYLIFYLNLFFEFKDKFSCSLPLALGLKHTLLVRENSLRWFRCWGLFVCWLFCHLFQEDIIAWIWIAQNAVGIFCFTKSLFKSRKKKKEEKKESLLQMQFTRQIPQLVTRTKPTSCMKSAHTLQNPLMKVVCCLPAVWHPELC